MSSLHCRPFPPRLLGIKGWQRQTSEGVFVRQHEAEAEGGAAYPSEVKRGVAHWSGLGVCCMSERSKKVSFIFSILKKGDWLI